MNYKVAIVLPYTVTCGNIFFIDPRLIGLRNDDGVSCYANSIIKCLLSVPPFVTYITKGTTALERAIFVNAEQDDYERLAEDVRKHQSPGIERADVEEELPQDAVYYGGDAVPDDHDPLEGLSDYTAADQQSGAETCRNERRRRRSFQKAERFRQT
uniref:Uncharacterized protein n=1 Tax=Photinus pyralis TaxID=7054 RepID=A0A1Y1NGM7_PHOPY